MVVYERLRAACRTRGSEAQAHKAGSLWNVYEKPLGWDNEPSQEALREANVSAERVKAARTAALKKGTKVRLASEVVVESFAQRLNIQPKEMSWVADIQPFACVDFGPLGFRQVVFYAGFVGRELSGVVETVNFIYAPSGALVQFNANNLAKLLSDEFIGTNESALQEMAAKQKIEDAKPKVRSYTAQKVSSAVHSVSYMVNGGIEMKLENRTNRPVKIRPDFIQSLTVGGNTYALVYQKARGEHRDVYLHANKGCVELTEGQHELLLNPGASCDVSIPLANAISLGSPHLPDAVATAQTQDGPLRMLPIYFEATR
ncbi:hypothetical protein OIN59_07320 [Acidovorax sp. D2M1]|uniref:Uncharacterized protein n=1 Tax=Acidovorax benzenivorans TaxID=2987520 RepID=A0ABT5RU53_9BURK|nr:hypothetical protein [Acidovorax benzenivorans]MDD2177240.1 hypothetical protein [Acidovorax benzenivorans]